MPRTFTTRPYSKVTRDMWGDERFEQLSPVKATGQDLWIYLLTGPHGTIIPGLIPRMALATLAQELSWKLRDTKRCWAEIETQKMAEADWKAGILWLPNGFRHNVPANPNVVTGWRSVSLPQCDLVRRALAQLRLNLWVLEEERIRACKAKGKDAAESKGWVEAFDEVFRKGFPEAILAGFPEALGESETRTRSEAETRTEDPPQPPASRGARVSLRRPSPDELKRAQNYLRSVGRCPHDPRCGSSDLCMGRLIYLWRHNQVAGMVEEAAS